MIAGLIKNPLALKRLQRFKEIKRAYYACWILAIVYAVSLGAELFCNSEPLYVRFNGRSYYPVFKFYPDNVFTGSGKQTRPDYHQLALSAMFKANPDNYMLFTLLPYGPLASIDPQTIQVADEVELRLTAQPLVGTVNIAPDGRIKRAFRLGPFLGKKDRELRGQLLTDYYPMGATLQQAVERRFANQPSGAFAIRLESKTGRPVQILLSPFKQRSRSPRTVRLTIRQILPPEQANQRASLFYNRHLEIDTSRTTQAAAQLWQQTGASTREELHRLVQNRFLDPVERMTVTIAGKIYTADFIKEDVRFPFRPVKGHWLGLDNAGRDVLARVLYGLRTSMTFGLLLVVVSMVLGIIVGAVQGYYAGAIDIISQRLIEIWSALPFLYIMILLGSIYGRSFTLLLICYGIFNWIGISYYMRAEFLRLRKQPFVEAAKCMGIPARKVIFRHILPNGLIPIVTFFPFSLVGAIGSLAALDYLGFGLPPPTPSWGELLAQAQVYRWAWWLILYPSLALFIVMLLGVFVGEGIRNAYDPKRYTRLE